MIPSEVSRNDFTGDQITQDFDFTFKTPLASWVEVFIDDVEQVAGFTVALNADQEVAPGGTVTFALAPDLNAAVRIQRQVPLMQETAYVPFRSATLEEQLDRLVMQDQQLARTLEDIRTLGGIMGPAGADGSIANITQNLDFVSTYKGVNVIDPANAQDTATKHYVDPAANGIANLVGGANWTVGVTSRLRKFPNGLTVLNARLVAGAGAGLTAGTLAAGYRPGAQMRVVCLDETTTTVIEVDILANGTVQVYGVTAGHTYSFNVTFVAEG